MMNENAVSRRAAMGAFGLLATLLSGGLGAHAQEYPAKPIRLIVPSPPGGGTDTLSRLLATRLSETLKWQIVTENKPGAGGNIGMDVVAKSAPDGYTIALGESSNLTINPYLYSKMPYDAAKDLAPVALVGTVPLVLVTAPSRQFDSIASVVVAAKQKPLTFASGGNGTVGHLAGELWKRQAGIDIRHIPYRGGGPAITDVIGGQVDLNFASIPAAGSIIAGRALKALAVTAPRRVNQLPDVPTFDESGYKGFSAQVIYGIVAPAGTPPVIVSKLNEEINRVLEEPQTEANLAKVGVVTLPGSASEFATFLEGERAKWSRAIVDSGAKIE